MQKQEEDEIDTIINDLPTMDNKKYEIPQAYDTQCHILSESDDDDEEMTGEIIKESYKDKEDIVIKNTRKRHVICMDSFNKSIKKGDWPSKTNIHCWWCCHQFDTVPIAAPFKCDDIINKFYVRGNFCSFNCITAYCRNEKNCNFLEIKIMIQNMARHLKVINTKSAPPREALKIFGGYLDIEEFRNRDSQTFTYLDSDYYVFHPPPCVETKTMINKVNIDGKYRLRRKKSVT